MDYAGLKEGSGITIEKDGWSRRKNGKKKRSWWKKQALMRRRGKLPEEGIGLPRKMKCSRRSEKT